MAEETAAGVATETVATTEGVTTDPAAVTEPTETVVTEGTAATEPAPAEETAATEGVTYADFELPGDMELDAATLEKAAPVFEELGLTKEQAQKLVSIQAESVQAAGQKQAEAFQNTMEEWKTQAQNDKEYGGDSFEENVKIAQSAVNKLGTPELKKLLEDTGVGNHPEVVRFMYKVGKLTAEDVPGNESTVTSQAKDRVSILYPNTKKS